MDEKRRGDSPRHATLLASDSRGYGLIISPSTSIKLCLGDTLVLVRDRLDVTLTGAGSIRYRGDPKVTSRVSGIGSIEPAD